MLYVRISGKPQVFEIDQSNSDKIRNYSRKRNMLSDNGELREHTVR